MPYSEQTVVDSLHPDFTFKIATPDMLQFPEDLLTTSGPVWHGVAIGWSKDISANIIPIESTSHRIVGVRMMLAEESLLFLSFYAPTAGKDDEFLESISNLTEFIMKNITPGEKVIIGADANCSTKSSNRRQCAWANFCEQHDLKVHAPPSPTFHHNNGISHSYIDLFAASSSLDIGVTSQLCTLEDPLNASSHDPIMTTVRIVQEESHKSKYSDTYTEFIRKKVVWDDSKLLEYQTLAAQSLSDALSYWGSPESLPLLSALLSSLLVRCATMVFNTHTPSHSPGLKPLSLTAHGAQNSVRKMFEIWKADGKPTSTTAPSRRRYADARAHLQRVRRQEKNLLHIKQHNHLMFLDRTNKSRIFSAVRKMRGEKKRGLTPTLHTPVGSYQGEDVLEGFAADAEHLAKSSSSS